MVGYRILTASNSANLYCVRRGKVGANLGYLIRQCCISFLLLLFVAGSAQSNTIVFSGEENVRAAQGLPSDTAFSLVQDQLGFVWVGTPSGIGILDGYEASTYTADNGTLVANYSPGNLYIDANNKIWVGTWGQGLFQVSQDRQSISAYPFPADGSSLLHQQKVQTLLTSRAGDIWVGTFDDGLIRIQEDGTEQSWQQDAEVGKRLLHNRVWSIAEDRDRNIWVGTSNGLNKINVSSGEIQSFFNQEQLSIANRLIRALLPVGDYLWVGTNLGVFRIHIQSNRVESMLPADIAPVAINRIRGDGKSGLWIATFNGLFHFDLLTEQFSRFENGDYAFLASKDIRDILVTADDLLILATRFSGVIKLNTAPKTFQNYTDVRAISENKNHIFSIATDQAGHMWAGTNNGLVKYSVDSGQRLDIPTELNRFQVGRITALVDSQEGREIWFGTSNGLLKYDTVSHQLRDMTHLFGGSVNHVQRLLRDSRGNLWVTVSHQGIFKITPGLQVSHYHTAGLPELRIPNNTVVQAVEGTAGDMWLIAGDMSLMRKPRSSDRFEAVSFAFSDSATDSKLIATAFAISSRGIAFIGTYSGLVQVNLNSLQARLLTVADGLSSNDIRSIIEDEFEHIWVATGNGISVLSHSGDVERILSQQDGLSSNALNMRSAFHCLERALCYGTDNGINLVRPAKVIDLLKSTPLVITNVWINNVLQPEPVTGKDRMQLRLDSDRRNLRFQFADIDHAPNAGAVLYYKLRGFEDGWNLANISRIANYTNLAPGNYVFEVTTNPQSLHEGQSKAAVDITIVPPLWQRPFVQVFTTLLVIMLAVFIYRVRIGQVRATENRLNRLVSARTENMAVLGAIGMEITRAVSFDEIFERLKHHLKSVLYGHKFMLGMVNDSKTQLHFDLVIKEAKKLEGFSVSLAESEHPAVWSFQQQHELIANSRRELEQQLNDSTFLKTNSQCLSLACIPLKVDDSMLGVIFVQSNKTNAYTEYERQFLRTIAGYTAIALKNAHFYKQEKELQLKRISWLENITHYLNHEMKNAILGAQTSLSMMSRKTQDADLVKYIGRAKRSHDEMRNIMSAVSNTTSMEAAIMRAELGTINLSEVLQLRALEYKHIYKNVNLVTDIAEDILIRGNADLMTQCLDKLVNNAIEHHKPGTNIILSLKRQKNHCRISVRNLGDPLPEDIEYIFGLFTSTKADARSGNFGMGLYIASLIVDLHDGAITAKPFDLMGAEGAIFELDIPLYEMPFNQADIHQVNLEEHASD